MSVTQYSYTRQRRQFGRQCWFSDFNEHLFSIPQRADLRPHFILRNPVNRSTQLSVQKAKSDVLTDNVTVGHRGMVHTEGGWPRDVNINDEEQTLRYRKKIEREDSWIQVVDLCKNATSCILQNNAVNIYQEYFGEISYMEIKSEFEARPINLYHDPVMPSRPLVQLDWCPGNIKNILALHSNCDYYPEVKEPNEFFVWDIENPLKTVLSLTAPTWTRRANYCPRDETLIAGGLANGKVVLWDSRIGGKPTGICPLEAAHREAVAALCWVHSKSNTEFYTGAADGSLMYWDGRSLKHSYMQFLLDPEKTDNQVRARAHGCTVLEFEYTIPIRYIAGDDMGYLFLGNRKGLTPMEALVLNFKLFHGPIRTIERNPFFVKNFLIIGDWCAKIWSEECKDFPTTFVINKTVQFMCGTWSTSRCSVFVTGDQEGCLEFWDILLNQRTPIYTLYFKSSITSIRFKRDGEFVAISLEDGDFHLIEMDEALRNSGPKEKALLGSIFDREVFRSKLLQDRIDEIKLNAALAAERALLENQGLEEDYDLDKDDLGEEEGVYIDPDPQYTAIRNNFLEMTNDILEKMKDRVFVNEPSPFEVEVIKVKDDESMEEEDF